MFERTLSFWRRLVGREAPPKQQGDERRLWVRFPTDLATTIQPTTGPHQDRFAAKIKDISVGGAYVLAERRLDPGQLITLELPEVDLNVTRTILACVVRVEEKAK